MKQNVQYYRNDSHEAPFLDWLCGLKDLTARTLIYKRIAKLQSGHFGDTNVFRQSDL